VTPKFQVARLKLEDTPFLQRIRGVYQSDFIFRDDGDDFPKG